MRRVLVIAVIAACGTRSTDQRGPDQAAAKVASARRAWLGGNLDGAIADLTAVPRDPHARALLARAYDLAGKPAEVAHALAASSPARPEIATDTSRAAAVVSPDGVYVATIDAEMTVWDTLSGRTFTAKGSTAAFGVVPTTGATWVVSPGPLHTLRAWDAATGALAWTVDIGPHEIYELAIDRHGVITAGIGRPVLLQYDLATGAKLREIATAGVTAGIQVSDDAHVLLIDDELLVAPRGAGPAAVLDRAHTAGADRAISEVLSPDGNTLALATATGEIFLDDRSGRERAHIDAGRGGQRLAFAPGNVLIAIDGPGHIRRFDPRSGALLDESDLPEGMALPSSPQIAAASFSTSGQLLVPHEGGFAVIAIGKGTPHVISRFGARTRVIGLAWSPDGAQLAIVDSRYAGFVWTPATGALAVDPRGNDGQPRAAAVFRDASLRTDAFTVAANRVWIYRGANDLVQRYVEASTPIAAATRAGGLVAAADATGLVRLWNDATGEGLGDLGAGGAGEVTAVALAADGKTLAVARGRGGIEMWDVPSRSHLVDLSLPSAAAAVMTAVTDDGRWDGDPSVLVWRAAEVDGTFAAGPATPGLAALALAQRPAGRVVAATPAAKPLMPGCLPPDAAALAPVDLALAGDSLTLCERHEDRDPYCFDASLVAETAIPIATPIAAIAPRMPRPPPDYWPSARPSAHGVRVCSAADACREVPMRYVDGDIALSADGTLLAVEPVSHGQSLAGTVATYDTATGKPIARFAVHYGSGAEYVASMGERLAFLGHTLLAIDIPCIGPCGSATMYSVRGRKIGALAVEASTLHAIDVGHERFLVKSYRENAFTIQDAATGAIITTTGGEDDGRGYVGGITGTARATTAEDAVAWDVVVSGDRIVRVLGTSATGEGAEVMVYSLDGKLSFEFAIPRCASSDDSATKTARR